MCVCKTSNARSVFAKSHVLVMPQKIFDFSHHVSDVKRSCVADYEQGILSESLCLKHISGENAIFTFEDT